MATTAQQVIDRAVQRSSLNSPDLVPTAQLLQYITQYERALYQRGARMNPDYFGKDASTATRAAITDSWDLAATPGDVGLLTRAEVLTIVGAVSGVSVGQRVELVLHRMPEVAVPPRAYVRGRKISQISTELGSNGSNLVTVLKVFYSPIPAAVAATAQSITTPDEWADLVVLPLARTLAARDRRLDEIPAINEEFVFMQQLFDEAVIAFDMGVRRPLNMVSPLPLGKG